MAQPKITIRGKLLLLSISLVVIMLVIISAGFSAFSLLDDRDNFRSAESLMLQAYQSRSEFHKRREIRFADEFHFYLNKFDTVMSPYLSAEEIHTLYEIKADYKKTFEEFVRKMIYRGLDENSGVEGEFRESVHKVEDIIASFDEFSIYVNMLQCRRSEKDYIMRLDRMYIDRFDGYSNKMKEEAFNLDIPYDKKLEIIRLTEDYSNKFHNLVQVFDNIKELVSKLDDIERQIQGSFEQIVTERDESARLGRDLQIVVAVIFILIGIILSIFISSRIANSISEIRHATMKISRGNYETFVEVNTGDEIQELAETFNKMVVNIRNSSNTILDQQKKLIRQNQELESLTSNLRQSLDNINLLGDIGRSVTAALSIDEIMNRLYSHLCNEIDISTFGIALVNEKENSLEYKLVIDKSHRLKGFNVNLVDYSRMDCLALLLNKEIIIHHEKDDISSLIASYPEIKKLPNIKCINKKASSGIYNPIIADGEKIAVLVTESEQSEYFKKQYLDMIRSLASYIAIALINANSYLEIKHSNYELKRAQALLIQSEKMASLGQLTAGIAHEIKNPLNFIYNYSDGTIELCREFLEEFKNHQDRLGINDYNNLRLTVEEVIEHLNTIHLNGARIDRIIKSMMTHARGSSTDKETVELNTLLKDYTKLAYHGFKSQYKDFNISFRYDLDDANPSVSVVTQELSRVITNIIENACYSLYKKKARLNGEFKPEIITASKELNDRVEFRIKDNGLGMNAETIERIFQPFYTTKPAGEGTGLGMSFTFDIINAHGGNIKVDSVEGEFAEFIIILPED